MIDFHRVRGSTRPKEIEISKDNVFVASNIIPYEEIIDDKTFSGFEYDYKSYTKDEYIELLAQKNAQIDKLQEEQEKEKILLGVE